MQNDTYICISDEFIRMLKAEYIVYLYDGI